MACFPINHQTCKSHRSELRRRPKQVRETDSNPCASEESGLRALVWVVAQECVSNALHVQSRYKDTRWQGKAQAASATRSNRKNIFNFIGLCTYDLRGLYNSVANKNPVFAPWRNRHSQTSSPVATSQPIIPRNVTTPVRTPFHSAPIQLINLLTAAP